MGGEQERVRKDKQATLDFIKWMVSSDEGKNALSKEMSFSVPFTTFGDDDQPENPLTKLARSYADEGKKSVTSFPLPSQQWQDDLTSALLNYVQGGGQWSDFESAFTNGWKKDWDNNKSVLGMLPESKAFDAIAVTMYEYTPYTKWRYTP